LSVKQWLECEERVPSAVTLIENGVDLSQFRPRGTLRTPPLVVGFAGQWAWKKGFPILLEAARLLSCRDDVRFRVAGSATLWGNNARLDEATREALSSPPPNVELIGQLRHSEMPTFLQQLNVLTIPSTEWFEGMPLIALEALACGIPLIATNVPGTRDIVIDGFNGLLVEPKSVSEIVRAVTTLADDPLLREALARGARSSASKYSLDRQVEEIEQRLQLLSKRP